MGLLALASLRIVATYSVFNHTVDEPAHLACGIQWYDQGLYTYEPHHPPLARIAMALGPFLMGRRTTNQPDMYKPPAPPACPSARSSAGPCSAQPFGPVE